jgi:hypothetical protein
VRRHTDSGAPFIFKEVRAYHPTTRHCTPYSNFSTFSKPNQSLQSYEPTCVLRVQKELDCGAESHSGAETFFVQLSHCHHFGNTHSRKPHAPDRSTATKCPLILDSLAFSPHLLYIYRAANINFKFSRFSAPPFTFTFNRLL